MKYKIEDLKEDIYIGPLDYSERVAVLKILESKGILWTHSKSRPTENTNIIVTTFPYLRLAPGSHSNRLLQYSKPDADGEVISYKTFMEHNKGKMKPTGYKVIKDFPQLNTFLKVGDTIKEIGYKTMFDDICPIYPEFFEPIYKEKRDHIEVEVSDPYKQITIYPNGGIQYEDYPVGNVNCLGAVLELFKGVGNGLLNFNMKVNEIWIGCEKGMSIQKHDIERVIKAYKEEYED